jgi:hypothetical protein
LNYPWDTWPRLSADNAWWIYTSREYADTVHLHAPVGYMNYKNNGITNGYAWYYVHGGRQDYMNYFHHCRESTIEISDEFVLPENQLIPYWNYNYRSFLNYIEQAGYGLHGLVTDSVSGEPLHAEIFISGFDKDSSNVYTDPQVGDYHRLLKGGSYTVNYSASGYIPKTIAVNITDRQTTLQNVKLTRGTLSAPDFIADQADLKIYPNPVTNTKVIIESKNEIQLLEVIDLTGKIIFSSAPLDKSLIVECNWPSGIYLFQTKINDKWISKKIQVLSD